ncbi:alanine racemase [Puniceicoccus vermicola]|uniref:Alanine racemase n=1 Tax=Puniceicoccus vermicola TaxID=388746 RepID=A0A7X1B055_9BACT|nr:alanine racemase [Puniceicoccus vermicola]MBC2603122.1 alanine racemase [Puniceicoccus vermicola]
MSYSNQHRCWVEIDLGALERNLGRIRDNLPQGVRYVAVVKADAYGHGVHQTASRLMQANADAFAVANVEEGARLLEIARGWPILVLGPVLPEEENALIQLGLVATVSSCEEAIRFSESAGNLGQTLDVHVKIDTGMGRLGVWHEEATRVFQTIASSENLRLRGIYTHYSDAVESPEFTREQRARFVQAVRAAGLEDRNDLLIHADNSAGTEAFDRNNPFNAVRVGLLQFGVTQYPSSVFHSVSIEPVFRFFTRVGLIKSLPAGTPVSYGRTYVTKERIRTAILTAGYGDGIPTAASNRGEVLIRGQRCPILGRVTMDQTVVDVTKVENLEVGEKAVIIGRSESSEITVSEFSRWTDSIPWEVFCSVTKRVPRLYSTARK